MDEPTAPRQPWWRRAAPFVLAAGFVAFVLARIDLRSFGEHVASIDYPAFVAFLIVITLVVLVLDVIATGHVYRATLGPLRYRDFAVIRAASYLPGLLSHHVGQAWLTWFLSRTYQGRLWRVAGATLLVYLTTFATLVLFATLSIALSPGRFSWLPPVVAIVVALGVAYLGVIALRPAFLARRPLTAALVEAGVVGHLRALALRIPHLVAVFVMTWIPFRFFGIDIPVGDALVLIPPLLVLVALPITPAGVGTRDAYAVQLLAGYAAGAPANQRAAILASTLTTAAMNILIQIAIALVFMHRARRLLATGAPITPDR